MGDNVVDIDSIVNKGLTETCPCRIPIQAVPSLNLIRAKASNAPPQPWRWADDVADFASLEGDGNKRSVSGEAPCSGAGPEWSTSSVRRNSPERRSNPARPPSLPPLDLFHDLKVSDSESCSRL